MDVIRVRVIGMSIRRSLGEEPMPKSAKETGAVVAAEDHSVTCGPGGVVANCLAVRKFVGVQDQLDRMDSRLPRERFPGSKKTAPPYRSIRGCSLS